MSKIGDLSPLNGHGQGLWDGIVIGAGPAGAMAARQLALAGRRVLLVDKKPFPRWKVCGACLNGQALAHLGSVGLGPLVTRLGAIELSEFHVGYRGRTAKVPLPEGVALSRSRLDEALVEAATADGAQFLQETHAVVGDAGDETRRVCLTRDGETIDASARVVLVATGLGNGCSSAGSATKTSVRPGSRIGAGCRLTDAPRFYDEGTIFMAVGRKGYVGTVRVEDGSLNVAAAFESTFVRHWGAPGPAAAAILAEAGFPPVAGIEHASWQGTAGLTRQTRPVAQQRLFLLGDAAGYVEPFTGEGIAWALASAQAVVPIALAAMDRWDPRLGRSWDKLHHRLIRRRQVICRAVALGLRLPWLTSIGFEVLCRVPASANLLCRQLNAHPSFTNAS